MKINIDDFIIKQCTEKDLEEVLNIQDEAFRYLGASELLRKNTPEMLLESLRPPHITLGAWYGEKLVAFSVLYFPADEKEDLAIYLEGVELAGMKAANYKLCIVRKDFRGNSLQYELGSRLMQYAAQSGINVLCATASPHNAHSIHNIELMGFKYNKTLEKYGYMRNLYYKVL